MGLVYKKGSDKLTVRNELVGLGNSLLASLKHSNKSKTELQTYIEEMLNDGVMTTLEFEQFSAHDQVFKNIEYEIGQQLEKLE